MSEPSIRITHRAAQDCNPAEITIEIGAATISPTPQFLAEIASTVDEPELVPGTPTEANDALVEIANDLGCACTTDDMLHAIDALRRQPATPQLEWSPTLCDGKNVNFAQAEKACAELGEGWRLPTRQELESILDLSRHTPCIDTARFPDTKSDWYWTSTPCAWSSDHAWVVVFSDGYVYYGHRSGNNACVRAVRSVPSGQ